MTAMTFGELREHVQRLSEAGTPDSHEVTAIVEGSAEPHDFCYRCPLSAPELTNRRDVVTFFTDTDLRIEL